MEEDRACLMVKNIEGEGIAVCVVPKEDMSKNHILVIDSKGKEKWFDDVPSAMKTLRGLKVLQEDILEVTEFFNKRLRSLRRESSSFSFGSRVLGFSRGKEKEI